MDESLMISTTMSHLRTFHVEMFSTCEIPAGTFYRARNYASIEDFQDIDTENVTLEHG